MQAVPAPAGIDPTRIHSPADLVAQLDLLRRRAARGTGRAIISLDLLSRRTGLPRSTVHSYIGGVRLPPADALDSIVLALGANPIESAAWAEALERLTTERLQGAGAWRPLVPRQLPVAPTGFTGRQAELAGLDAATAARGAESSSTRVVTVTGPGGVGKTALVLRWAHEAKRDYPDGQVWVDLRGFSASSPLEPVDALEQLLRAVGVGTIDLPADLDMRAAMFRSAVAGRRLLVVLDNARDSAQVRPLLPGTSTATTVVTSRNTLRSLAAREGAERLWLGPLGEADARALLGDGLSAGASAASLGRIAALCEGLPLALRIVRERLSLAPADEVARFAERLEGDRESLLAALDLDDGAGDASVRGVLRWSYDALPPEAAEAFRYIPLCLIPTFDVQSMAVLLDKDLAATRRLLDQLVAASLLDVADADHYRVHDLVAAFAEECLSESTGEDELEQARVRLWRYICAAAESAIDHTDRGRPIRLPWPPYLGELDPADHALRSGTNPVDWMMSHVDLACAAIADAATNGPVEYSWLLAERTWRAIFWVADVGRFEEALEIARRAAEPRNVLAAGFVCRLLGITQAVRGDLRAAESAFTESIRAAETLGNTEQAAMDRSNRARVWSLRGDVARAIDELTAAVEMLSSAELGLPTLGTLTELELQRGNVAAAKAWGESAHRWLRTGDPGVALTLEIELNLAQVDAAAGEFEAALAMAQSVAWRARSSENRELTSRALTLIARILLDRGETDGARKYARSAVKASQNGRARQAEAAALAAAALVECSIGQFDLAIEPIDRGLEIARSAGRVHDECDLLILRATALAGLGDVASASRAAKRALRMSHACNFAPLAEEAQRTLARARSGEPR